MQHTGRQMNLEIISGHYLLLLLQLFLLGFGELRHTHQTNRFPFVITKTLEVLNCNKHMLKDFQKSEAAVETSETITQDPHAKFYTYFTVPALRHSTEEQPPGWI